ncbi:MAG TPA: GxxExxY protein [Chitinophagaceae bacterium]|jgi:GxxExxY protein|nr:GxxExxY protein [Chitinophagaceae bacterium]
MQYEELTSLILQKAIAIHNELGPGLYESIYEEILCFELRTCGRQVQQQAPIPVIYKGIQMAVGFRADLVVDHKIVVEIKSIDQVAPVHKKQVLTYLRLTGIKIGLLINFNEELLKNGVTRLVDNFVQ